MKCLSCDVILSAKESTRKYASTGEFVDLCDGCFDHIREDVAAVETNVPTESSTDGESNEQD